MEELESYNDKQHLMKIYYYYNKIVWQVMKCGL